jgi:hypothetical protein
MEAAISRAFGGPPTASFDESLARVIGAVIKAHLIEADLHRALELEPVDSATERAFDASMEKVRSRLADILTLHRSELRIEDGRASAFVLVEAIHAIAHAAVRNAAAGLSIEELTREAVLLARGYLNCPR